MHIIKNAVNAIDGKGDIWVKIWADGMNVFISVRDNGGGIAEENKSKIFDPFYTTKKIGEGLGLGLSISYEITKRHGGKIEVVSEEGKGSEFKIFLPDKV